MRATAGVGRPGTAAGGAARRGGMTGAGGFSLGGAARPMAAGAPPPLVAPGAESLLALQAATPQPVAPATVTHAEVMLDRLDALQRALTATDPARREDALARLATELATLPRAAADPVLADILDGLAARAAVELARQGALAQRRFS